MSFFLSFASALLFTAVLTARKSFDFCLRLYISLVYCRPLTVHSTSLSLSLCGDCLFAFAFSLSSSFQHISFSFLSSLILSSSFSIFTFSHCSVQSSTQLGHCFTIYSSSFSTPLKWPNWASAQCSMLDECCTITHLLRANKNNANLPVDWAGLRLIHQFAAHRFIHLEFSVSLFVSPDRLSEKVFCQQERR